MDNSVSFFEPARPTNFFGESAFNVNKLLNYVFLNNTRAICIINSKADILFNNAQCYKTLNVDTSEKMKSII